MKREMKLVYFHMDAFLCISVHSVELLPLEMSMMPEQFAVLGVHLFIFALFQFCLPNLRSVIPE